MSYLNSWNLLLAAAFVVCLFSDLPSVGSLNPADFQSEWILMESQSTTNSFREVEHGLVEVPLKVKVLVTPVSGPYFGWIFEAGSSQQTDDDLPWMYCGILYTYNVTHVQLFAPKRNSGSDGGRAFCIDSLSWTSGSNTSTVDQIENQVFTKIMAWRTSSFPSPDMESNWTYITSDDPFFLEIAHDLGREPCLVQVQTKCNPMYTDEIIYSEGVGAGSLPKPTSGEPVMSGIVFAYNVSHIRIWKPNSGYSHRILCIRDGYARDEKGFRCSEGEFQVKAWLSVGEEPQQFSFQINEVGPESIPDMSALIVNIREWNAISTYVSVQVKALDGPNAGFIFPAIGQVQRNAYPESSYGGVTFGISNDTVRIFVPANDTGSIIHVPANWGLAEYSQMSNNVQIIVRMWSTSTANSCSDTSYTVGRFTELGRSPCTIGRSTKCAALCLSDSNCVGVISCPVDTQCRLMDLNIANNRMLDGVLGTSGEVMLAKVACN